MNLTVKPWPAGPWLSPLSSLQLRQRRMVSGAVA